MCLLPTQGKLMQSTLRCLQRAVHNITNIYTEAVLAYAFALAGDYETTQELLYKLEEQAIKSGSDCWLGWSPLGIWSNVWPARAVKNGTCICTHSLYLCSNCAE